MVALDLNLLPTSSMEPRPPNQQNLRGLTPTPLLPLGEGWGEGGAEGEDWEGLGGGGVVELQGEGSTQRQETTSN